MWWEHKRQGCAGWRACVPRRAPARGSRGGDVRGEARGERRQDKRRGVLARARARVCRAGLAHSGVKRSQKVFERVERVEHVAPARVRVIALALRHGKAVFVLRGEACELLGRRGRLRCGAVGLLFALADGSELTAERLSLAIGGGEELREVGVRLQDGGGSGRWGGGRGGGEGQVRGWGGRRRARGGRAGGAVHCRGVRGGQWGKAGRPVPPRMQQQQTTPRGPSRAAVTLRGPRAPHGPVGAASE